jgi:hypothetical protein
MATLETGDILNAIGQHTADILGKTPHDAFVFIEAGDQWMGAGIFENLEDRIVYHSPNDELLEDIQRLWEAADPDKKWSILLYDIKDGHFDAEFLYTDDLKHHPFEYGYRADALTTRYGDKPIVYPPMDDGDWHELTEDELANLDDDEDTAVTS